MGLALLADVLPGQLSNAFMHILFAGEGKQNQLPGLHGDAGTQGKDVPQGRMTASPYPKKRNPGAHERNSKSRRPSHPPMPLA